MNDLVTWVAEREAAAEARGYQQAAIDIADKIRRELVCCDAYDRHRDSREDGTHAICFWGEASARLAQDLAKERTPSDEKPLATGGPVKPGHVYIVGEAPPALELVEAEVRAARKRRAIQTGHACPEPGCGVSYRHQHGDVWWPPEGEPWPPRGSLERREKPAPTCPVCGEHVTGFESEPGHPIPNSGGYVTYLSILTKYDPCGHVSRRAAPDA
ncbi:MAG: hypothetical protein V4510_12060 [bacterium]